MVDYTLPTGGTNRFMYEAPSQFKEYPIDITKMSTAIKAGDAVWYDRVNQVLLSAADFPWQGSLARTQAAFAGEFAGISRDFVPLTATAVGTFLPNGKALVAKGGLILMPIASATWKEDALVSLDKATGNALDPKNAVIVTDPALALGKAMVNSNGGIAPNGSGVGTSGTVAATSILFEFFAPSEEIDEINTSRFFRDPGTGVAIALPAKSSQSLALNIGSAGAETNTVAAGKPGQKLLVMVGVIGTGTRAITFTGSNVDGSAHAIVTFDAIGDFGEFVCGGDGLWVVGASKGLAYS